MKQSSCVLLCVFLFVFSGVQAQTGIGELFGAVGSLGSVLQMFKRDSTTKFGDLQSQKGFTDLESHTDYATGAVKQTRLPDLFKVWLHSLPMEGGARQKLIEFMQESEFQEFIEPNQRHVQDFKFSDAKGKIYYLKVLLQAHPSIPDVIKWEKVMWTANFQVSKPFMVVTKSKCSFFGCKTKDSIQYFQATLTQEHIDTVKSLAIPFMSISNPAGQTVLERKQA
jgi:hypothetical protein